MIARDNLNREEVADLLIAENIYNMNFAIKLLERLKEEESNQGDFVYYLVEKDFKLCEADIY